MFFPYSKLHPLFTQVLHELQLSTSEEVLLEFAEVKSVCADHIWRVQAQEWIGTPKDWGRRLWGWRKGVGSFGVGPYLGFSHSLSGVAFWLQTTRVVCMVPKSPSSSLWLSASTGTSPTSLPPLPLWVVYSHGDFLPLFWGGGKGEGGGGVCLGNLCP